MFTENFKLLFQSVLFTVAAWSFISGWRRSQQNGFYGDTPWLLPLGIFVWGDALVIGPFWMIAAVSFSFLSWINILRFVLFFFLFRSLYEVIYWINHQVAHKEYQPPLFRNVKWLGANEAAILYQLLHMCQVIGYAMGIIITFVGR